MEVKLFYIIAFGNGSISKCRNFGSATAMTLPIAPFPGTTETLFDSKNAISFAYSKMSLFEWMVTGNMY